MALSHLSLSNPWTQLTEWESAQSDMKGNEEGGDQFLSLLIIREETDIVLAI